MISSDPAFSIKFASRIREHNAIVTWIPKCASTAIRLSVAVANGAATVENGGAWVAANNRAFMPSLGSLVDADYAFVMLRDPFRRLESCYRDRVCRDDIRKYDFSGGISFAAFVRLLDDGHLRGNHHWRPQVDFLVVDEYDDWFCVEEFDAAQDKLLWWLGLDLLDARHLAPQPVAPRVEWADDTLDRVARLYADDIALYESVTARVAGP